MVTNLISPVLIASLSCGFLLTPANAQRVLFADDFNRSDNSDLNASATGKSGTLGALNWSEKSNGGSPEITGERLQLGETGAGGGWSIVWADHNFTDSIIATQAEFTVSVDIANLGSSGNTRFNGFAVGNALADLTGWNVNLPSAFTSDFFIGYDPTGTTEVKIFLGGTQAYQQTINLTTSGATLSVRFHGFSDFDAGTTVQYEAFINGGPAVKTGSFTWSGTNENYINLYSNYTGHTARSDNFTVSTLAQDTDGDGLPNWWEEQYFGDPTAADPGADVPDNDGVTNLEEFELGTNPTLPDSDGDGLLDGGTITVTDSDSRYADWAALGILFIDNGGDRSFRGEAELGSDPTSADTDGDELADGVETGTGGWVSENDTGTDPLNPDTDGDGLADGVETNTGTFTGLEDIGSNPHLPDTDGDGAGDWYEVASSLTDPNSAAEKPAIPYPQPEPDPLDTGVTDRPVKVYIMSGQSNMVGFGTVNGASSHTLESITLRQNKFPNLIDGSGAWTTRSDVSYRGLIADVANTPLSPGTLGTTFGPELGFGYVMGWYHDEPVLLIKSSIGNRSLGFDILPPGSTSYEYGGSVYGGYGQAGKWAIGGEPDPDPEYWAGWEWDRFFIDESEFVRPQNAVTHVVDVLDNFANEYPDWAAQGFEIAGFVWWQGDKDRYDPGLATRYEQNLAQLIRELRSYYETRYPGQVVPDAPFVLATLGQTPLDETDPEDRAILDAQLAVDGDAGNYPDFVDNVKTVYAHPLNQGGASNGHYNLHAMTYMLVGDALGRSMVELLENQSGGQSFAEWMAGHGSGLNTGFDQDADDDGIDNGVEAFFGTLPFDFNPGLAMVTLTGNALSFTHPQSSQPLSDVTGSYEWSLDLSVWHASGAESNGTTVSFEAEAKQPSMGTTTVTANITGTVPNAVFVRVNASQP